MKKGVRRRPFVRCVRERALITGDIGSWAADAGGGCFVVVVVGGGGGDFGVDGGVDGDDGDDVCVCERGWRRWRKRVDVRVI